MWFHPKAPVIWALVEIAIATIPNGPFDNPRQKVEQLLWLMGLVELITNFEKIRLGIMLLPVPMALVFITQRSGALEYLYP
jgi:hypothetical protein